MRPGATILVDTGASWDVPGLTLIPAHPLSQTMSFWRQTMSTKTTLETARFLGQTKRRLFFSPRECYRTQLEGYTHGLIEIFNRSAFEASVGACYSDPLSAQSSFLCLLYLTFAIGTVLGTPLPSTREDAVFKKLRTDQFNRAEMFFRSAKSLADPVSGFEDADFWSVQALSLMAVYMLAVSKRNAAYAYFAVSTQPSEAVKSLAKF
ncbi:hypothetical protein BN1723_007408 [Verticillium longisporum]|uniref:Xylanolytic transcriptional activator regulatory domain-containing protein n=1 Tax=Verticillium longisporum TaxID=100787 RepID=A0A0G4NL54_VERLO|nr:hypothetical protein BN1723_007408 [Verticillium longisporum]